MKKLETVTLLGVDCLDIDRLILAANICQEQFEFAAVKLLTSVKTDHKDAVQIEQIDTVEAYSRFMLTELHKYVDTSHVLIIQYDGFILNPQAWSDEFLKYDYIGAPWLVAEWAVKDFGFPARLQGKFVVGNGGFSMRSRKLLEVCRDMAVANKFDRYHPEDVIMCVNKRKALEKQGIVFAPVEIAKRFSYEAEDAEVEGKNKWNGEFGFHGLRWTDISNWTLKHPEYRVEMKKNSLIKLQNPSV